MSLDPHWFSTIYGDAVHGGPGPLRAGLHDRAAWPASADEPPLQDAVRPGHVHDLGKLMLAFVDALGLRQLLAVPDHLVGEPAGGDPLLHPPAAAAAGSALALVLVVFHFALPFLLLLSRDLKRNARAPGEPGGVHARGARSSTSSGWSGPTCSGTAHGWPPDLHWLDLAAVVGVGGALAARLRARSSSTRPAAARGRAGDGASCWRPGQVGDERAPGEPRGPVREGRTSTPAARAQGRRSSSWP